MDTNTGNPPADTTVPPKDTTTVPPKDTTVTPPDDTAVTPPATTTQPDTKEIEKKLESSITERVSKTLLEKIGGALGLTKEQEEKLPTDPKELLKMVREESRRGAEELLSEQDKKAKKESDAREKQVQEGSQRFQQLWKDQYNQLAESGKVPKIVKADDKNDPGNIARVKILTKLHEIVVENQKSGVDYVPTLKEVFYENPDILRTDTIAGARAPISGGGRATTAALGGMPYKVLHETSLEEMVAAKNS